MASALERHDALIEQAVAEHGGHVVRPRGEGDSRFAVFARASDAVSAAVAAQRALMQEAWPGEEPLRVRMAVHTGEADLRLRDYYGLAVNHCGNLRAVARGGQVLVSAVTAELVRESLSPELGLRDLGLQQLKGLEVAERVWQAVHPDLPADFPRLAAVAVNLTNLPSQLSSFIGREEAIAQLENLLSRTRLVTLTGPGGIGKTRLALALGNHTQHLFVAGVWLVRLEALTHAEVVPAAVASVLGVGERAGQRLVDTISQAIGSNQLMLIFDNCEHLIQACAELADALLQTCPQLHIVATSREPLGLSGESVWRVSPLGLPDAACGVDNEPPSEVESVRLFVDRARAAHATFELTERNAPTVAEICTRLGGLPLAIELAAARITTLTVEQIEQRLDDSFRLLAGGRRTSPPRQQALRATIDWSYDLLTERERTLFRRLCVFAGGWTLEAAEAVCRMPGDVGPEDVLNQLSLLVDKSLVIAEDHQGEKRYRLLDAIRRYAGDLLETSREAGALRRRHAEYYAALAEQAEPTLRGPDQQYWFRRLEVEHDNARVVLEFLLDQDTIDPALRLGSALWYFWYMRGHLREGSRWLDRILARASAPAIARGRALNGAGYLALALGESQRAIALHEEALELFETLGDAHGVAMSRRCLGRAALSVRDLPRASAALESALRMLRQLDDTWGTAICLNNLGNLALVKGENENAGKLYTEALQLRRQCGDLLGIASSLSNLGLVALRVGEIERGAQLIEQALVLQRDLGNTAEVADSLSHLGSAARMRGELQDAATLFEQTLVMRRRLGTRLAIGAALVNLADVSLQQGAQAKAARLLLQALALQTEPEDSALAATTFETVAYLAVGQGYGARATRLLGAADSIRDAIGAPRPRARGEQHATILGSVRVLIGDAALASELAAGRELSLQQAKAEANEILQLLTLEG